MINMKLIRSFAFAWNGLRICFLNELNFRIHILLALIAVVLGVLLNVSTLEWIATGFCIALVISMEMLNTAMEKLCDVVHKDFHPGIKKVKDIAAGAVLVSAIFSFVTGLVIYLPKLIVYFKS